MPYTLSRLLEVLGRARMCLADWQLKCGEHFSVVQPLLVKSIGEISDSYPAAESPAVRYTIDPRGDRFAGFVVGVNEFLGYEDRWFDVEDLQIWVLDPEKVAAFLGPMNAPQIADKPVVKVINDFASITLPDGRSCSFGRKYKRRAFLRAVAKYCRDNDTDIVPAETVISDLNAALPDGDDSPKAIRNSDVVYGLFKGQSDVFKELFEIRDLSAGIFRLKVTFEAL